MATKYNKIFLGYQLHQLVEWRKKNIFSPFNQLTQLVAREDFITGSRDEGPSSSSPLADLTMSDMLLFLAVTIHALLRTTGLHLNNYTRPFTATQTWQILRGFLHFCDNSNKPDMTHENYDKL
jgi:hypothetical protein